MKIALVSPYDISYPGGVTEHVVALAAGATAQGHTVHVLAPCSGFAHRDIVNLRPVSQRVIPFSVGGTTARLDASPLTLWKIHRLFKQQRYDVIHLQEPLIPGLNWWVLLQTHRWPNTVTVGTFHAYRQKPLPGHRLWQPLLGRFFRQLDGLIAVSDAARDSASRLFPGDYQVIPNGIDLSRFRTGRRFADGDSRTILFVGRQDNRKGFATLFEAFLQIKPLFPGLRLQVVGPFEPHFCRHYQKIASQHGVTGLTFEGYILPKALPAFYGGADIFCAPSLGCESFGIVLLEAMAAGLPVVASDIVGYRTLLRHGQQGLLVPPGQPVDLAEALTTLLQNPDRRLEMGRQGQLTACQYSWDRIIDRILDVYVNTESRAAPKKYMQRAWRVRVTSRRQTTHVKRTGTQA